MSRPAAALNPGQTNRRFVILAVVLGLIGAVLVYVAFSRSDSSSGPRGNQIPVVIAKTDIAARTKITASMLEVKLLAEGDASALAYADTNEVVGRVTRFPIAANEQVLSSKVVDLSGTSASSVASKSLSFAVPAGRRAMAVKVTDVIAAGGLVLPGDYVDIIVVYDVEFQSDPSDPTARQKEEAFYINTLYQNIEVLAVSQTVVDLVPEAIGTPGAGQTITTGAEAAEHGGEARPGGEDRDAVADAGAGAKALPGGSQRPHSLCCVRPYGDVRGAADRPHDRTRPVPEKPA